VGFGTVGPLIPTVRRKVVAKGVLWGQTTGAQRLRAARLRVVRWKEPWGQSKRLIHDIC